MSLLARNLALKLPKNVPRSLIQNRRHIAYIRKLNETITHKYLNILGEKYLSAHQIKEFMVIGIAIGSIDGIISYKTVTDKTLLEKYSIAATDFGTRMGQGLVAGVMGSVLWPILLPTLGVGCTIVSIDELIQYLKKSKEIKKEK
jgi:hypothetical protein